MRRPWTPHLVGFELFVQRIERVDAEVVDVQHDFEAKLVGPVDEGFQLGVDIAVVGVIAVVAGSAPARDVQQGLRGVKHLPKLFEHLQIELYDDQAAHILHP